VRDSSLSILIADRYQLQERLNPHQSQGSRQTWLAEDLHDRRKVVVKLAPLQSGLNWADFKLFEREATILGVLDHPRIPKYLDFLELDTPEYQGSVLVQEYIDARSFQAQVEAGQTFTCEMVKDIAIQVLEILNYLHTINPPVIHRDIKPSNLLLGDRSGHSVGQVYLVDFGAVQTIASAEYDTFTVVGSYGYMPFEQFGGQCVSASDLYSLGATLIYLLTGQHPADLPQVNGQLEFSDLMNLDWKFHQWLKQMVAPAVSQRFGTTQEALVKLKAIDLSTAVLRPVLNSTHRDITLERTSDRLVLTIFGYKFNETLNALTTFAILSYLVMAAIVYYSLDQSIQIWMMILPILLLIFTTWYLKSQPDFHKKFVATLIIDQQQLKFRFNGYISFCYETFKINNIKNIFKIEQVMDGDSRTTVLILWDGIRRNSLSLTDNEAAWVGKGLSEWLGVPFEQRKVSYLLPDKKSKKT
jgi:serine/threonine protein kinase